MDKKHGTIKVWKEDQLYGFINPSKNERDVFFHLNGYSSKHQAPRVGMEVEYMMSKDKKDRICAVSVTPIKGFKKNTKVTHQRKIANSIFIMFCVMVMLLYYQKLVSIHIPALYVGMSILSIFLFFKDKRAALKDSWRTSEETLLLVALLGGWPGAFLAQSYFRHKSRKVSFRVKLWLTVVLNCVALYWLVSPRGQTWFSNFIHMAL